MKKSVTVQTPHQGGQSHRASGNFTTKDMGENLVVWPSIPPCAEETNFDIMHDVSGGIDTKVEKHLGPGTRFPNPKKDNLYFANVVNTGNTTSTWTISDED